MTQPLSNNKNQWFFSALRLAVYLVILNLTMFAYPTTAADSDSNQEPVLIPKKSKTTVYKAPLFLTEEGQDQDNTPQKHQDILFKLLVAEMAASRNMESIALNYYLQAAELSQNPQVAEQSTLLAINRQAPLVAIPSAKLWAKTDPKNLQAQLVAMTLLIGHSIDAAIPFIKQALELEPTQADQYIVEIQTRLSSESANNLKTALNIIATQQPNNPYVHLAAGESAIEQNDLKNAHYWIDSALKLNPNLTRALELKTRLIHYETKSYAIAIEFLLEQLEKFPNNKELRFFYATMLLEIGNIEEGKYELLQLTKDKAVGGQSLLLLGEIYLKENSVNKASSTLEKALAFPEAKESAQYLLAEIAEKTGKIQRAIQQYSMIESGPYHIPAVLRAVFLLKLNRDYREAIFLLRNCTPTTLDEQKHILLTEVDLLNTSKQSEQAMQLINEILIKLPNDTDALFMHAITAAKLKNWDIAETDLKKILKQNPNNANALNNLGYVLSFNNERAKEALIYLTQALALAPNNPVFMDSIGWVYYRTGNLQQALIYLKKANVLSDDGEIAAHLGEVLWMSNHKNEAILVWKKALNKHNDNEELLETLKRLSVELNSNVRLKE